MSNTVQWSSSTPGYLIFLIDQSGSMTESYSEGKSKAEFTALVINRTINEIINTNLAGDKVKNRVFISLIGYGGKGGNSVEDIRSDYLSEFANNPLRIEKIKKKVSDGAGGLIDIEEDLPVFIEPVAIGSTPMGEAFNMAKKLIEAWKNKNPNNPAPIIINISDGMPYEGNFNNQEPEKSIRVAKEIMSINTNDGPPLIFNVHIGNSGKEVMFAADINELHEEQAKFLFEISSVIPDSYKAAALKYDFKIKDQSRGFIANAKPLDLIKFINFGSSGANSDLMSR
ncbi:MAG: hypothetical protein KatS3mg035_1197 [Bacteroidia bacterium]|nr:MAG: hypothetical protein KatS3mg035_1197 [Bacteroidia bacterium]